ncbi:hypothetical protein U9M48_022768, partial [Paspalum notatum var. saurae]
VSLLIYFNILNQLLSKCIIDKSWMDMPRQTNEYTKGVDNFLEFAFSNSARGNKTLCPCKACQNCFGESLNHGEPIYSSFGNSQQPDRVQVQETNEEDDVSNLFRDLAGGLDDNFDLQGSEEQEDEDMESFYKLVKDASQELYLGCRNFSKLCLIIRLLHIKFLGGGVIKNVLPEGSSLRKNFNAAKNMGTSISMLVIMIAYCFIKSMKRKMFVQMQHLKWKSQKKSPNGKRMHRVPMKVLWHFPVKKRFQRFFMSSKTAPDARWYDEERIKDGLLRHPVDAPSCVTP